MRSRFLHCLSVLGLGLIVAAAESFTLEEYLPPGTNYDSEITTPSDFLGYKIGDWHLRHDQLLQYLKLLSQESPRLTYDEIGRTHEHRALVQVTVTSARNHERLEEIRTQHLQLSNPDADAKPGEDWPVVVNMGYSVHGDESSGSNAVPLFAYHLAAGRELDDLLDKMVILIDPCLNPDGFSRFAQWANSHRGRQAVPNNEHREHHAAWPGGRTNHYWFDLNRDWLLAQHPESHARLARFHAWRPNVVTDFHEMGSESTYFFQPGVPERKHPLTPTENVTLTGVFADEHAKALDRIRSLYFTEERFDDFYYGKGSTYPDVHGGVGILFEQASTRGHVRESPHGQFDFPFTIRNHVRTSLSTLEAALAQRERLLAYQQEFYQDALALARAEPIDGYVFGQPSDASRLSALLDVLHHHQIEVYQLGHPVRAAGKEFQPEWSYVLPLVQPQFRLIKALFETRTTFEDDIFYDVSTWTLPLAFGVPYGPLADEAQDWRGKRQAPGDKNATPAASRPREAYAYAIAWDDYWAPKVLYQLQKSGVRVSVATVPLHLRTTSDEDRAFARGTLLIPAARQRLKSDQLARALAAGVKGTGITVHEVVTGLTTKGVDLGSNQLRVLKPIRPALVVGNGVSHYEAGEVWHLLDHRMGITLPLLEAATIPETSLARYSHLILVDGSYAAWSKDAVGKLKAWVQEGGILVTQKRAARWASSVELLQTTFGETKNKEETHDHQEPDKDKQEEPVEPLAYGNYHDNEDAKRTSGAIFRGQLDRTHPLGYGYGQDEVALFRNSNLRMRPSKNPYATPLRYAEEPLLSGYVYEENLKRFSSTAALVAEKHGKGAIIAFVDNPNFRAFWYGTNKLFLNALFFSQVLESTEIKKHDDAAAAQDHHH